MRFHNLKSKMPQRVEREDCSRHDNGMLDRCVYVVVSIVVVFGRVCAGVCVGL